ncbi:hypothetical protein [uncultured Draconibacterium sp.]|uniref:exo-rhamnogalacturonan lyase family protein n=1 Tax=uncultured Draconibacterium sp. TaxID=1573823 RepID=UPI0025F1F011|nr:hypothetical protein [uncultured Draconibacterium sp.]
MFFIFGISFTCTNTSAQNKQPVIIKWLGEEAPTIETGVSWGVPFKQGEVKPDDQYLLKDENGDSMPVQSWPLAYWPDGSIKWIGLSTVVDSLSGSEFRLIPGDASTTNELLPKIEVKQTNDAIEVNTGLITCRIPRMGKQIINSIKIHNKEVSTGAELVCIVQDGPETEYGAQPIKEKLIGNTSKVTIEQHSPVRSVIKIEGNHQSERGDKSLFPFVIRLYFYAGQQSVKIMHTFIYDGDQNQDFVRGIGLVFDVPLDEEFYNRHVRFSAEKDGLWAEPVQPLVGRRSMANKETYPRQLQGKRILNRESLTEKEQFLTQHWASWNDFKLYQANASGFRVRKRTNDQSAWIDAGAGGRASGLAFVGDVSGGLAVCMRSFWQSFPSTLEICHAKSDTAKLKTWLWSPDAEAMDMRHYDTLAYGHNLEASYEDVEPGFSIATGVGRTSELLLFASTDVPSAQTLNALTKQGNNPALLSATPEYIHSIPVFGAWSLPDKSSKGKAWLENELDKAFNYYQLEVEQRNWYGFWDFGDVMHAYDRERHTWRYDIGGYAWDNTELMPNMWLWYSYLRSGKAEIFRMAEAMTRHNGEVDVYHLGRFAGLGSRHNVRHWGCGAKEVRISQAALSRFYYYLTTDERTGDLMRATVEGSNKAIGKIDPLRKILDQSEYPTHARMGPDWLALIGNWMTEWERTGDEKYKNMILAGVNDLAEMPYGLFSGKGAAMGYNPATQNLFQLDKDAIGSSHLSVLMGGPEVAFELSPLLNNKRWDKLWLQFCRLYGASADTIKNELGVAAKLGQQGTWYARLPAYYAKISGEKKYAEKAWSYFLNPEPYQQRYTNFDLNFVNNPLLLKPVYEVQGVSTNHTAQWCLNAIELLELIGDQIPDEHPVFQIDTKKQK